MKLPRRTFLHLAAGAAGLPVVSQIASADAYPSRPVHVIVGFPPAGGTGDTVARLMGQWLSQRLGTPFIIENRPGAGTNLGTEMVVRAVSDGYTLLLVTSANFINATLYEKLNFNFIRDIAPIAGLTREPAVMVVHPSVPAKSVPEFIAYAKVNPGKLNFASGGIGAPSHVFGELFKMLTGVSMVHVPYRGAGPALTGVLGNQAQVYFSPLSAAIEYITTGKLRPLAVSTATRSDALPDLPTISEFVPDFEESIWYGIGAPRKTPTEIIDNLNKETNVVLADERIKARIADLGETVLGGSPAEAANQIAEETEKWGKVIKFCGARAD